MVVLCEWFLFLMSNSVAEARVQGNRLIVKLAEEEEEEEEENDVDLERGCGANFQQNSPSSQGRLSLRADSA